MIRVIKRYGSRKLYDAEESRYVSLEELGDAVRAGQQIKVLDTSTDEDVTAQTLMQVMLEEGRRGTALFSSDILHALIRRGEHAVNGGVEQLQDGMGRLLDASFDRISPLRRIREETSQLRERLARLETAIADLEVSPPVHVEERRAAHGADAKHRQVPVKHAKASRV